MSELFRFMLARPATPISDTIVVGPKLQGKTLDEIRKAIDGPELKVRPDQRELKFGNKISQLNTLLPGNLPAAQDVLDKISNVFQGEDLAKLVAQEDWAQDEQTLDLNLVRGFLSGKDLDGSGPELSRQRQLYELVRVAAAAQPCHDISFKLKPLMLPMAFPKAKEQGQTTTLKTVAQPDNSQRLANLSEVLNILDSSSVLQYIDPSVKDISGFNLQSTWTSMLSTSAHDLVTQEFPTDAIANLGSLHRVVISSLQREEALKPTAPKSGLFSFGPASVELTTSWKAPFPTTNVVGDLIKSWLPDYAPSMVTPSGIGDLIVVRNHIIRYEGGEIGNIQNVLKTEHLVRETKRLDRTVQVQVTTQSTENEEERDASSTERFSLNRESSNVIKEDSAFKAGLSVSAKYGPTVEVKADTSVAENGSKEVATKVASQFSKDVTSRAASKVIQKTFTSTSMTTINQYEENFKHEFDNTKPGASNVAGIYQWVNKVSQSQMYNYGQRLLFDIVVPEPAAFLMDAAHNAPPVVAKPQDFTESSKDINEVNYATIAAQYQTTGIKAPPELLMSFAKSFKGDANDQTHAGSFSVDIPIPAGYLAFSVSVVEQQIHWDAPGHSEFANLSIAVAETKGNTTLNLPFVKDSLGVAITTDHAVTFSGTIRVNCIRSAEAYANWQHTTYDTIAAAYTKLQTDYERAIAEAAVGLVSPVSGDNPDENLKMIRNELKKACITILTSQTFDVFDGLQTDPTNNIIETAYWKATVQGRYIEFFEQAFEWEELQYVLYPYYWSRKSTWKSRLLVPSTDPVFADFVKAGAARVSFGARLNFTPDVLYFLQTGQPWHGGPVSGLQSGDYLPIAQEIADAEARADREVPQGPSWETSVPTSLVKLRDEEGAWTWEKNGPTWEKDTVTGYWKENR
jgi:hypothetical protein